MNARTQQIQEILCEALEIADEAERSVFVSRMCGSDPALRQELDCLVKAGLNAGNFLPEETTNRLAASAFLWPAENQAAQPETAQIPSETIGDSIGRYRLLRKLGEGGCGTVYLAEQEVPISRKVALKIIKLGMDTREVVARFEAERQALAMMDHPNIARVFDAGATATGRPFFVMELVNGIRITDFCDNNNLSTKKRLELFVEVCHAVQHAHQKGVVHRDLKPSNVLVATHDTVPIPKVIDFGIAKATQGRLTDKTLLTAFEQFIGTPAYVSPEQAEMTHLDIDTRSDIYSLGVLLYELLTGKTPFDQATLTGSGLEEMRRVIREKAPLRPSTRLRTMPSSVLAAAAFQRSCDSPKLIHLVRGDLDWIVMKCLEKDRARRYATANALAMDIVRHLKHEPVIARPPNRFYEFRKIVRRHTVGFAIAALAMITLSAGVIIASIEAYRAKQAERRESGLRSAAETAMQTASQLQQESQRQAEHARSAVASANEALRNSFLAQAQAGRWSRRAGRRFDSLQLLAKAAAIQPGLDLRNEAIACMALPDFQLLREWQAFEGDRICGFDSKYELYAFNDLTGAVHLCRVADGKEVTRFDGFEPQFQGLGFSPDSRLLTVSSGKLASRLALVDIGSGSNYWSFAEPRFRTITFTADGRLAAASYERPEANFPIRILDIASKTQIASFNHGTPAGCLRFHPVQTNLLLVSGPDAAIQIWDWETGRVAKELPHPGWVMESDWNPTGRLLATTCADNNLRLWDTGSQSAQPAAVLAGHEWTPVNVSWSYDGEFLLSRGWDGILRLWDPHTFHELASKPVCGFSYPFALSNLRFAAFTGEGKIGLFEAAAGQGFRTLHNEGIPDEFCNSCDFSPDGQLLVSASYSGVRVRDPESGAQLAFIANSNSLPFARFSPDGRHLLVGTAKGIQDYHLKTTAETPFTGKGLASQQPQANAALGPPDRPLELELRSVFGPSQVEGPFFFNEDGNVYASESGVAWYDTLQGKETRQLRAPANLGFGAISPDAKLVAEFGRVGTTNVNIWRLPGQGLLTNLTAHPCFFCAFSPDNRFFASGDQVEFRLRETRTWQTVCRFPRDAAGHYGYVCFSPDSQQVAAAISRSKVLLVEVSTGKEFATLESPERTDIHWLVFGPDGSKLAVAAGNGSLQIWNLTVIRQVLAGMKLDW